MTPDVLTAHLDDPLSDVRDLLLEENISAVPVVDDRDRICGVVTETDLLRCGPLDGRAIREVMSTAALRVTLDTPLPVVVALMTATGTRRAFVTDDQARALGVVSALDIVKWVASRAGYETSTTSPLELWQRRFARAAGRVAGAN